MHFQANYCVLSKVLVEWRNIYMQIRMFVDEQYRYFLSE